ncbi:MAG: hypothetical protein ACP5GX_03850 [Anaerolineae bacterium]
MKKNRADVAARALEKIVESARQLGIEMDQEEAEQWLMAMTAGGAGSDVVVDVRRGIFGHRVSMLDFSPEELDYFRKLAEIVEFEDRPGKVETALALSGSAAQSKIQTYPGDADFFERVNIKAETREEACQILAEILRDKALERRKGPTYQLMEVKMGSYTGEVVRGDRTMAPGSPISWTPAEIDDGKIEAFHADGTPVTIEWEVAAQDPGWCKLDWVVADPVRKKLANVSNMLDVTWEAPDGSIIPLDGYLDPYFQEVYLETESVPIFSKLVRHVSANALDEYVTSLEREVHKYLIHDPANYAKAAKRMYNVFRLTGHYEEAIFLRELFDEPTTMLYQVWALIRTVDEAARPDASISMEDLIDQVDDLIVSVIDALEGDRETEIVRHLLRLRDSLTEQKSGEALSPEARAARAEVINIVNNFFREKLTGLPTLKDYIECHQAERDRACQLTAPLAGEA